MTVDLSWAFVALAFVLGVVVLYVVGTAIRDWVFELSPREWALTVLLSFDIGAGLVAFLDGDVLIEILTFAFVAFLVVWWIIRLWMRASARSRAREAAA